MLTRNHKHQVGALVQPTPPPNPTDPGTSIHIFFPEVIVYIEGTIIINPGVSDLERLSCRDKSHAKGDQRVTIT
jgi:hypothetical protein